MVLNGDKCKEPFFDRTVHSECSSYLVQLHTIENQLNWCQNVVEMLRLLFDEPFPPLTVRPAGPGSMLTLVYKNSYLWSVYGVNDIRPRKMFATEIAISIKPRLRTA